MSSGQVIEEDGATQFNHLQSLAGKMDQFKHFIFIHNHIIKELRV